MTRRVALRMLLPLAVGCGDASLSELGDAPAAVEDDARVDTDAATDFDAVGEDVAAGQDVAVTPAPEDVPPPTPPPVMTCISTGLRGDAGGTRSGIDQAYTARRERGVLPVSGAPSGGSVLG